MNVIAVVLCQDTVFRYGFDCAVTKLGLAQAVAPLAGGDRVTRRTIVKSLLRLHFNPGSQGPTALLACALRLVTPWSRSHLMEVAAFGT
jgi:hypothetical protein